MKNFNIGIVIIGSELQKLQMRNFDDREEQKKNERREKILYEKRSRDKQLEDEMRKKRDDRKKEKELDQILVQRIQEEITEQQALQLQRKV